MSERQYYDRLYTLHENRTRQCRESVLDIGKAFRRVGQVLDFFRLAFPAGARALDVGCGLGFYTEALHRHGFEATGIDISAVAVETARRRFPAPAFRTACFPGDIAGAFELVWAVDVSLLNTFEQPAIDLFFSEAIRRTRPGGALVIGWHTDFGGRMIENENWAGWDLRTIGMFRNKWGLEGPAIVQARNPLLNFFALTICRILKKSAPVFLVRRT